MWISTDRELPPEGEVVNTISDGGHEQELVYQKGLWFFPDHSMYVYYVPAFWRRGE